jgi:hypothetical protein
MPTVYNLDRFMNQVLRRTGIRAAAAVSQAEPLRGAPQDGYVETVGVQGAGQQGGAEAVEGAAMVLRG